MSNGQPSFWARLSSNGMQFCLLMSFVFMWILQMDALMFGEDDLRGFIPKTSFNMTAMVVVVSWLGVKLVIMAKQTSSK
jgi:cytosine/uracil/thiamine/allantoin permease